MRTHRGLMVLGILALGWMASAQSVSKTLAVVDGETITEDQVNRAVAADLTKLESSRPQPESAYNRAKLEILWKGLNSIVEDKLVAAEAARQQVTREHLLEAEVESNVEIPSNAEVEEFYEANKERIPIPRAEALPQVKQYMVDQSRKRYRDGLIRNLKRTHVVTTYLDPLRTDVPTVGYPSRGPVNATVTIVEFSDFECPFCGGLFPTLKLVERNYPEKVRLVYRQFPLTNLHPHAQKAAEASLCANEQKRFWEFHDSMFGNQADLTVEALKRRAVELKLDSPAAFNACLDSGKQADSVKKDSDEGVRLGVTSTPTMFINGRQISGNQPYADIRAVIEDELQRSSTAR